MLIKAFWYSLTFDNTIEKLGSDEFDNLVNNNGNIIEQANQFAIDHMACHSDSDFAT